MKAAVRLSVRAELPPVNINLSSVLQIRLKALREVTQRHGVLLIFDEILKKGFDGHNFIVGLSEHLRDLLVVKDEATVELLQVSESAKERYLEQTARATVSFLLSGLNLANQCDIHYKTSKNQRLHVELTLMKVAKLSQAFRLATLATVEAKKKA